MAMLFWLVMTFSFCAAIPASHAEDHSVSTALEAVPAGKPVNISDKGEVTDLDREWVEVNLKTKEATLREIKEEHARQKRRQYIRHTERLYKKAVNFYRQQRLARARDAFRQVEYLMTCYKSTCEFLNLIDRKLAGKPVEPPEDPQLVNNLVERAEALYTLAEAGGGQDTAAVRQQLSGLKKIRNELRQKRALVFQHIDSQELLDQMEQEAAVFNQEILKLSESGDYLSAEKKSEEFLQEMRRRLVEFKKIMALRDRVLGEKH